MHESEYLQLIVTLSNEHDNQGNLQAIITILKSAVSKMRSCKTNIFKGTNETIRNNIHDSGFNSLKLM